MFSELNKPNQRDLTKHPTKRKVLVKFAVVALVFIGYFLFVAGRYGLQDGLLVAVLTWSFFVLCTPIADAGFLLDFPLRIFLGLRMIVAECLVWVIAISLNAITLAKVPEVYEKSDLLSVFQKILENPWPFWLVIAISAVGTFISVKFGDELVDKAQHKQLSVYRKHRSKYRLIVMAFVVISTVVLYDALLAQLDLNF